jgi:DNA-binding transcriptional LysR family regulator
VLDTDQLRSFLAIVDHGSFTRAAERVNKTQSAVSMHIRRLEEKLGCQLFLKSGRGVELSPDGEKLIEFARRIIGLETNALLTISKKGLNGRVRFGIPDDYADPFLPEILKQFLRVEPLVEVTVVCEGSLQLAERISDGKLDLALVSDCEAIPNVEVVREEQLYWVGSQRLVLNGDEPVALALSSPSCMWRQAAEQALESMPTRTRLVLVSNNFSAIGPMVGAGLAVTVLPASAIRDGMKVLEMPNLLPPLPKTRFGLTRPTGQMSDATSALAEAVRETLRSTTER